MNLLDFLFPRRHEWKEAKSTFKLLNGYTPSFRNWNGRIYESELVRAAIDARARHISKLSPIMRATARPKMCAALERTPNRWQTWSQFLYRVSTILDVRNTCFIVKIRDAGDIIEAEGSRTQHPVYGDQFKAERYRVILPDDAVQMERYLASGAVKGIGEALAARIVKRFGDDSSEV